MAEQGENQKSRVRDWRPSAFVNWLSSPISLLIFRWGLRVIASCDQRSAALLNRCHQVGKRLVKGLHSFLLQFFTDLDEVEPGLAEAANLLRSLSQSLL